MSAIARGAACVAACVPTLLAIGATAARAQQVADTTFDASVAQPAFAKRHPKVLFDEAHHNFHTATGRYKAFADLITHDGCLVTPNRAPFTLPELAGYDILIISNALGSERMSDSTAARAAFTGPECDQVRDWVRGGGALLLIADHAPMGSAAKDLAARFGVDMRNGVTVDTTAGRFEQMNPTLLLYTRANGGLGDHPILAGRDSNERVGRVLAFTGQSLTGPEGSTALLVLSPNARDLIVPSLQAAMTTDIAQAIPAAGRCQGLAFAFGKGCVVVLGEAAMLSAQIGGSAANRFKMGMNVPGTDDRQFALNIVRWLGRALPNH
ncbi:MAG: DUF4350 domain-containing protein [Candidatus Eisenbacteria bacterium]|nr:DUF4350 domain-containing protein [Candidatus Eisenbacteria bacterium]